jgi:AsmA protein
MATPLTAELEVRKFDMIASGFVPAGSGLAGLLDFDGTLDSNGRQVQSKGRAKAEKLQLVKGGSPAAEPVSLEYLMTYDLLNQNGALKNATVSFGKAIAQINGVYETRGDSVALNMRLHGNNMPVQDLKALLPAFGVTLPRGASLEGGVLNANLTTEGPVENLMTSGNAELLKTRLVGFDLAGKMASLATLAGLKPDSQTEIEKFASGMRMTPDGIQVSGLQLIVPSLGKLTGDGKVGTDQALDFKMLAMLKPTGGVGLGLAQLFNKGGTTLNVPFFVRGTASEPRFIPDFKRATGGLLESALQGQGKKQGQTDTGKMLGDTLQNLFQKKK